MIISLETGFYYVGPAVPISTTLLNLYCTINLLNVGHISFPIPTNL